MLCLYTSCSRLSEQLKKKRKIQGEKRELEEKKNKTRQKENEGAHLFVGS